MAALSRALAILGYVLYDLDHVANGGPDQADFWLRAVQRKLAGDDGFSKLEIDDLLSGYDVGHQFLMAFCSRWALLLYRNLG